MIKYFHLRDDEYLPQRWYLDDPETDEGCDPYDFRRGELWPIRSTPNIEIKIPGIPFDFTLTLLDVPVATHRVAEVFATFAESDLQRIPATVTGRPGFEIINICRRVRCLDERLTTFTKWTPEDDRPDRLGGYRMVSNLRVDTRLVPPSTHLFRIEGWDGPIIVSGDLMEALLSVGAVGPKFTRTFWTPQSLSVTRVARREPPTSAASRDARMEQGLAAGDVAAGARWNVCARALRRQ